MTRFGRRVGLLLVLAACGTSETLVVEGLDDAGDPAASGSDATVLSDGAANVDAIALDDGNAVDNDSASDASSSGDSGVVLKARCRGIMTRDKLPRADGGYDAFIDSVVVKVAWSDLQPTSAALFDGPGWATIDAALAKGYRVRLRILAGINSPNWAKKLGGPGRSLPANGSHGLVDCSTSGGVGVANTASNVDGCTAYFWEASVQSAYESLMQEVAKRYEANDKVCEVVNSACMTVFAEVLYRVHGVSDANENLAAAGLTFAKDKACQRWSLDMLNTTFARTRISMTINNWDMIEEGGAYSNAFGPARDLADEYRAKLGDKLIFQNNGLGENDGCFNDAAVPNNEFCWLNRDKGPHGFQTETWEKLGATGSGLYSAVQHGLDMNANFVEMPSGYDEADNATLGTYDVKLEATKP